MELFFLENYSPEQTELFLSPEETRHLVRVLRKRVGDSLNFTDGRGHYLQGEIVALQKRTARIQIRQSEWLPFPAENELEIGVGIIRPNRMDWLVEKLTELGVRRIVPLICQYSTLKTIKAEHLRKISISAIKQSRQFYLPEITTPRPYREWVEELQHRTGMKYLAHLKGEAQLLPNRSSEKTPLFLAVGPEGGFHPDEIKLAERHHFRFIQLNTTVLRTETAAVVGTALLKNILRTIFPLHS